MIDQTQRLDALPTATEWTLRASERRNRSLRGRQDAHLHIDRFVGATTRAQHATRPRLERVAEGCVLPDA